MNQREPVFGNDYVSFREKVQARIGEERARRYRDSEAVLALAEYRLADRPETRATDCLRRSRDLMKRHLRPLFLLMLFAMLWQMTVLYLAMLFSGTGTSGVLSLVFQMLAGLVQAAYLGCAVGAFYLDLSEAGPAAPAAVPGEAGPNQTDEAE